MPSFINFDRWQSTAGTQFSNIIQTQSVQWTGSITSTAQYTYVSLASAGGTLTLTSRVASSKFMLMASCMAYRAAPANGVNIGFQRTVGGTTTRLLGVDGAGGDSWMGEGNGGGTNSATLTRHWLDSPGVPAGTSINYTVLGGVWNSGGGTSYFNYPGYIITSMLTVMEVQP
jgi:hypothetical protein